MAQVLHRRNIVIAGCGYASLNFISAYRSLGGDKPIVVLSKEPYYCYDRRKLYQVLLGEKEVEDLVFEDIGWYEKMQAQVQLGTRLQGIDLGGKKCLTSSRNISFDKLILASGRLTNRSNALGSHLQGVFYLRNAQNAIAIRRFCQRKRIRNAIVVGAGPLGIELAYTLCRIADRVFIIHRNSFPLQNHLNATGANFLATQMQEFGIVTQFNAEAVSFLGSSHVERVDCSNGQSLPADLVVICTGTAKNTAFLEDNALDSGPTGISVNSSMQTSDPDIFAVGDAAELHGMQRFSWINSRNTAYVASSFIHNGAATFSKNLLRVPLVIKTDHLQLFSWGDIEKQTSRRKERIDKAAKSYSCIYFKDSSLVGGTFINSEEMSSKFFQKFTLQQSQAAQTPGFF